MDQPPPVRRNPESRRQARAAARAAARRAARRAAEIRQLLAALRARHSPPL
jgi:hypothetical protein